MSFTEKSVNTTSSGSGSIAPPILFFVALRREERREERLDPLRLEPFLARERLESRERLERYADTRLFREGFRVRARLERIRMYSRGHKKFIGTFL